MNHIPTILASLALLTPSVAFAAAPRTFAEAVYLILGLIQLLIPVLFALTFIVLSWGVVRAWILGDGNAEKVAEGKSIALWGIIGLAVMSGLWGILALVRSSLFSI